MASEVQGGISDFFSDQETPKTRKDTIWSVFLCTLGTGSPCLDHVP